MAELLELTGERSHVRALFNHAAVDDTLDQRENLGFEGAQTAIDAARSDRSSWSGMAR
jgi:hypothetical protein